MGGGISMRSAEERFPKGSMHIHFVNENIGGHETMHGHLLAALAGEPDIEASFFHTPGRGLAERVLGVSIPGLGRLDLDLHSLRSQLARSAVVRRHLSRLEPWPDALHMYTHNAALLSVGHIRRTPTVVSLDATNRQNAYRLPEREPTLFTPATVAAVVPLERRVYRAARRIVTHSRWAADSVLSYGVAAEKVEVIPFGITVPAKGTAVRDDGPPRIVFVGSSMERKGGWRLVRMWKRWLADSSRLTLVTREQVAPDPAIEVRNDIRPGDGKLEALLAESDIFAMPGEIDSFGYALLEAMAAELPVVAPRQAAVPEIVVDGVTGIVVPLGDDAGFADGLMRLLRDRDARREMGEAARRRVLERFDARITTALLLEVIRDAAGD